MSAKRKRWVCSKCYGLVVLDHETRPAWSGRSYS